MTDHNSGRGKLSRRTYVLCGAALALLVALGLACGLILLVAKSAKQSRYEARFSFPYRGANEIDQLAPQAWSKVDISPLRTVAERGTLTLYFQSDRPVETLGKELRASGTIPELCHFDELKRIDQMPPKPVATQRPEVLIKVDRDKCARFGIKPIDVMRAASGHETKDALEIGNFKIRNAYGEEVLLREIAEVRVEARPSHVVRDFGAGQ